MNFNNKTVSSECGNASLVDNLEYSSMETVYELY